MQESAHPPPATRWLLVGALLYAFTLGVAMRAALAGVLPLPGVFTHLRHAHSHAAYFGVLFPLVWLRWAETVGWPLPGRVMSLYAAAAAVACVGFAFTGYAFVTIVASTVLGALWIASAWRARALVRSDDAWLRAGPLATAVSCLWIPPIGVMTPRDPALGADLAHSFLAFLLFLVVLPAALSRVGAARVPPWLWAPLGAGAALHVGVLPHPATGVALAGYGACMIAGAVRGRGDVLARVGLVMTAGGAVAIGLRWVDFAHAVAMAGVHVAALAAALVALTSGVRPRWTAVLWGSGATMASAIALAPTLDAPRAGQLVAGAAGAVALVAALALVGAPRSAQDGAAPLRRP